MIIYKGPKQLTSVCIILLEHSPKKLIDSSNVSKGGETQRGGRKKAKNSISEKHFLEKIKEKFLWDVGMSLHCSL